MLDHDIITMTRTCGSFRIKLEPTKNKTMMEIVTKNLETQILKKCLTQNTKYGKILRETDRDRQRKRDSN